MKLFWFYKLVVLLVLSKSQQPESGWRALNAWLARASCQTPLSVYTCGADTTQPRPRQKDKPSQRATQSGIVASPVNQRNVATALGGDRCGERKVGGGGSVLVSPQLTHLPLAYIPRGRRHHVCPPSIEAATWRRSRGLWHPGNGVASPRQINNDGGGGDAATPLCSFEHSNERTNIRTNHNTDYALRTTPPPPAQPPRRKGQARRNNNRMDS